MLMAPIGLNTAFESETFGQDASFRLEQPIGSMSISPSGRDVVLASKEGLHIIDLDSPYSPPRYLAHRTPWEVADVQWSPFATRDSWIISTSNQKALVWNLAAKSGHDMIEYVLHAHTRAITDINFSAHNPDVLATCAVDSFVHCWDLRSPLRPAFSFSDWFAGATQVKWNRQNEHVIASSHDKYLHIWDHRNGASPVRTIQAHDTKIYGVDWNRFDSSRIITCSLDKTIKFWNCDNPQDEPERVIQTPFPVWRARYTPFGWGVLAMPQRGSSDLLLYDRHPSNDSVHEWNNEPVATFSGHDGQVKEFLWRTRGNIEDGIDHRDFQLVSWGTDRELRLHKAGSETLAKIHYVKGESKSSKLNLTRRGARYRTFRDEPMESASPVEWSSRSEIYPPSSQLSFFRHRPSANVGMSKLNSSHFRSWTEGGRQGPRTRMHGKGNKRNEITAISWLKNVRIASWDPDAIAEEIKQVGDKFKKVEFESVDIQHRKAIMSLQAPWGDHQVPVYLRVEIRFPKAYPHGSNAIITLQKTSTVDSNLHKVLTRELHAIAEAYASQKRGCLEALLQYLLREQTVEQIVAWVLDESLIDSKHLESDNLPTVESSSDDDDDDVVVEKVPNALAASVNVPLAKGCGAVWAENGRLVCFFPPNQKTPASYLSTLGVKNMEDMQSSKIFEGFGRLHANSPARRATNGTKTAEEDSSSEDSDSLFESSSSSSTSSDPAGVRDALLPFPGIGTRMAQRSHSVDRSNRSTTLGGLKLDDTLRTTVISIHDFAALLPSTKNLAEQYRIMGSGPEVCRFNAKVASRMSRKDLSAVWSISELILNEDVPLELAKSPIEGIPNEILIVAKRKFLSMRQNHYGARNVRSSISGRGRWGQSPLGSAYLIPAMFSYFEKLGDIQMLAMLSCVFSDYSSSPNFTASHSADGVSKSSVTTQEYFPSKLVAKEILMPNITAEGYLRVPLYPSMSQMQTQFASNQQSSHSPRKSNQVTDVGTDFTYNHHARFLSRASSITAEDIGDHSGIPSAIQSLSTSPEGNRLSHRSNSTANYSTARASLNAITQSFSNSPPSGTGGILSSNVKKYSPSGSLTPSWVSGGIFGGSSNISGSRGHRSSGSQKANLSDDRDGNLRSIASMTNFKNSRKDAQGTPETIQQSFRSVATSDASDRPKRPFSTPKRKILRASLHNQDSFDIDSYCSVSLLDPKLEWKYKSYRMSYSALLESWQLYIQKAELAKVDGQVESQKDTITNIILNGPESQTSHGRAQKLGRDAIGSSVDGARLNVEIRTCCQLCGEILKPVERNGRHISCKCVNPACKSVTFKVPTRSACVICCDIIQGLAIPCLQCGHMTCYNCAQRWFGPVAGISDGDESEQFSGHWEADSSELVEQYDLSRACPSGCGCRCPTIVSIKVPNPDLAVKDTQRPHLIIHSSHTSRSERLMSESGPDTAIGAFLALARNRTKTTRDSNVHSDPIVEVSDYEVQKSEALIDDELNPWSHSAFATLGRGIGAGLSRGLSSKASDATIRKVGRK